jgi:CelD/BcsL family acetyltransferase involved in cellulose biosynthesis
LARVEKTLDAYLANLGSKTRADVRRQERRLAKQASDQVACAVFSTAQSIGAFLKDVEVVSRRTYQWNLLGMGIENNESIRALLQSAADRGWFRGYVLRCVGKPVAFMIGYLYRGVYLSESIGYDPDWAGWSVGNVLHLYVMRDLAALGDSVQWFDFLYGDNQNKERLSTAAHPEQNVYLIPDTLRWRPVVFALRAFDVVAEAITRLLERHQIKQKVRRVLRKRSTARATRAEPPADTPERY